MKEPKVYSYLKSINESEWKDFRRFARSIEVDSSDILKLINHLGTKTKSLPFLEMLHQDLFPNSTRKNVSNKLFQLKQVIEKYFIWLQFRKDTDAKEVLLIAALVSRGLYDEAEKKRIILQKQLVQKSLFDASCSFHLHKMEHNTYFSSTQNKYRHGYSSLDRSEEYLVGYKNISALQYDIERRFRKEIQEYPIDRDKMDGQASKDWLLVNLKRLRSTLFDNNTEAYESIISDLRVWPKKYVSEGFVFIIMHMILHTRRQMRSTKNFEDGAIFFLYELALEHDVYMIRGFMSFIQFENIIDLACSLRNIGWAKEVLEKYKNKVDPTVRSKTIKMCKALIAFYDRDYVACHRYLRSSTLPIFEHMIRTKWFTIMCFYEQRRWSELESSVNAFSTYIRNHKDDMSTSRYAASSNFISLVRKLINKAPLEKIRSAFYSYEDVAKGSWIKSKIEDGDPPDYGRSP